MKYQIINELNQELRKLEFDFSIVEAQLSFLSEDADDSALLDKYDSLSAKILEIKNKIDYEVKSLFSEDLKELESQDWNRI